MDTLLTGMQPLVLLLVLIRQTNMLPKLIYIPPIDSLNMWPLISGQNSTSPRVDILISNTTLISGDYKILDGLDLSIQIQLYQVEYLLLNTAVTVACTTSRMTPKNMKI